VHSTGHVAAPVSVYFERLEPPQPTNQPTVVMIHGGAHSGACYQRTAAGQPGWAYDLAAGGYPVVVPDWPGVGRSGYVSHERMTGELVVDGLSGLIATLPEPLVLLTHSMAGCYGWRLAELHAEQIRAVIGVAPSPPGNIQPATPVLKETDLSLTLETFGRIMHIDKTALNVPSEEAVSAKYVGASRFFPRDRMAEYRSSLLGVPPRILAQRRNVRGTQVRVSDPARLAGLPVLVLTGTEDIDHPRETDEAVVAWLNAQGAAAEYMFLAEHGIVGNGHMMMLEDNSAVIADLILNWLKRALAG
jgi:pimeloyl-ACP methyl ester carboxylesterase